MISFDKITFNTPAIPSVLNDDWSKVWDGAFQIPSLIPFPDFQLPSNITIPDALKALPPLIFGQPLCISRESIPDKITLEVPNIPKISISFGEPPQISCVCLVRSPDSSYKEYLDAKINLGLPVSTEEKCHAIVESVAKEEGIENFAEFVDDVYKTLGAKAPSLIPPPQEGRSAC